VVPEEVGDLVFTTAVGTPIDGISVTRRFQRILKAAGLPVPPRLHEINPSLPWQYLEWLHRQSRMPDPNIRPTWARAPPEPRTMTMHASDVQH